MHPRVIEHSSQRKQITHICIELLLLMGREGAQECMCECSRGKHHNPEVRPHGLHASCAPPLQEAFYVGLHVHGFCHSTWQSLRTRCRFPYLAKCIGFRWVEPLATSREAAHMPYLDPKNMQDAGPDQLKQAHKAIIHIHLGSRYLFVQRGVRACGFRLSMMVELSWFRKAVAAPKPLHELPSIFWIVGPY